MIDEFQYVQLMSQNMVLLDDNRKALAEVERLQKMVEKMRNCDNCKHEIGCRDCDADCDKWEIAE